MPSPRATSACSGSRASSFTSCCARATGPRSPQTSSLCLGMQDHHHGVHRDESFGGYGCRSAMSYAELHTQESEFDRDNTLGAHFVYVVNVAFEYPVTWRGGKWPAKMSQKKSVGEEEENYETKTDSDVGNAKRTAQSSTMASETSAAPWMIKKTCSTKKL